LGTGYTGFTFFGHLLHLELHPSFVNRVLALQDACAWAKIKYEVVEKTRGFVD
jgi:hypothetical protein